MTVFAFENPVSACVGNSAASRAVWGPSRAAWQAKRHWKTTHCWQSTHTGSSWAAWAQATCPIMGHAGPADLWCRGLGCAVAGLGRNPDCPIWQVPSTQLIAVAVVNGSGEVTAPGTLVSSGENSTCDAPPCNFTWTVSGRNIGWPDELGGTPHRSMCLRARLSPLKGGCSSPLSLVMAAPRPSQAHDGAVSCLCAAPQLVCPNGYNATANGSVVEWTTGPATALIPMVHAGCLWSLAARGS